MNLARLPERVCWGVTPGHNTPSRPSALLTEIERHGIFRPTAYEHHGRNGHAGRRTWWSLLTPARSSPCAVLSPLFLRSETRNAVWIDLYDDWSRAPEMRRSVKLLAAAGYRQLRNDAPPVAISTNSQYMRDMLAPLNVHVIPNGVEPALAQIDGSGDRRRRVVIMGKFFEGRTDWRLFEEIVCARTVDEVVVLGLGEPQRSRIATVARMKGRPVPVFLPSMPIAEVATMVGQHTTLAIPHLVSDYTISQDPMKAYQAVALGWRVAMPALLIPPAIGPTHIAGFGEGVRAEDVIDFSLEKPTSMAERRDFAMAHSWAQRASLVRRAIASSCG